MPERNGSQFQSRVRRWLYRRRTVFERACVPIKGRRVSRFEKFK